MSEEVERYLPSQQPAKRVSQTTSVEQSRAVAEVQAAVTVALQFPRDMQRAYAEMKAACGRLALAERAFYAVKNRGNGPSVHLARELARIWGNVDYGVRELSRDDEAGMSEIQAYAWDQQTNVRSSRTFQVPHQRMAGGKRQPLTDLGDVYLNNQNIGARAVREAIFTVLPNEFVESAQDICHATLKNGDGVPLNDRIGKAVKAYAAIGVSVERLEARIGKKRGQWDAQQVADLGIWHTSITRDGVDADSLIPERAVELNEPNIASAAS